MTFSDIIGLIGYMGLTGAFILCALLIILTIFLHFRSQPFLEGATRLLTHVQTALLGVAIIALGVLSQIGAFEYEVVFNAIENAMSPLERVGALWSGQASSLLFWSFIMSAAASISALLALRLDHKGFTRTVLLVIEATLLFFILPDVFFTNPFLKIWILPSGAITPELFPPAGASLLVPLDGQGMNPSLRHIAMLLHPPTLYLGLIGFFIPYAFAIASLVNGDFSFKWMKTLFPVALASWTFLTIGMLLGSWWAYTILGWGGYWGWDAVEISGLLPWLLSFGLVHSMGMYIRGKPYRRWVYALSFAIVLLIMFGILITRSGILDSVHAYTSGTMGPVLTGLIALHLITIIIIAIKRRTVFIEPKGKHPDFPDRLTKWFNYCLVGLIIIYLFGQTLPLTSQLFYSEKLNFKPGDFEQASAPLLLLLVIITALFPIAAQKDRDPVQFRRILLVLVFWSFVFPLIALFFTSISISLVIGYWAVGFLLLCWLYAFFKDLLLPVFLKEKSKSGRRIGLPLGTICIHLGFAVMALGIISVEFLTEQYSVQPLAGESGEIGNFRYEVVSFGNRITESGNVIFDTLIEMEMPFGGSHAFKPQIIHYSKLGSLYPVPAIKPGFLQDVQVVLEQVPDSTSEPLPLRVSFFPLMSWIWAGGAVMSLGGALTLASPKHKNKSS